MDILLPYSWIKEYLKTDATPEKFAEALSLCGPTIDYLKKVGDDTVFQFDITHNRIDSASVLGIVREASAILPKFNLSAIKKDPTIKDRKYIVKKVHSYLDVSINPPSLCPRFSTILLKDIQIGPSPKWMQNRLQKSGMRPLNNIVDISNYLMLETGQPMHTFDFDKIKDHKVIMRESKKGEKIITLDNVERLIPQSTIVIEDGGGHLIDLCGIMGGKLSEVDEKTKNVLLFVQTYDPLHIRKTSIALNHRTQAATIFEKAIDSEQVMPVLKRAVDLFIELTLANTDLKVIDIYPNPPKKVAINFNLLDVKRLIGVDIPQSEIIDNLSSLGFSTKKGLRDNYIEILVPSWRLNDVTQSADIVEEIARLHGYFKLPNNIPLGDLPLEERDKKLVWVRKIKDNLKMIGRTEIITYSLTSKNIIELIGDKPKDYLEVGNPMSDDSVYLRKTLIPSHLSFISENQANFPQISVFEVADIYLPKDKDKNLDEPTVLTVTQNHGDFYNIKGIAEQLFQDAHINVIYKLLDSSNIYNPNKSAEILVSNKVIGRLGELNDKLLVALGVKGRATALEINFDLFSALATSNPYFVPPSKFPPIIEDITFKTNVDESYANIEKSIKNISVLISKMELINKFQDYKTIRITYQSDKRNLESKEIKDLRTQILQVLTEYFKASIK